MCRKVWLDKITSKAYKFNKKHGMSERDLEKTIRFLLNVPEDSL